MPSECLKISFRMKFPKERKKRGAGGGSHIQSFLLSVERGKAVFIPLPFCIPFVVCRRKQYYAFGIRFVGVTAGNENKGVTHKARSIERRVFLDSELGWRVLNSQALLRLEAWRVVGKLEGGQTQAEVAQAIGVSQSVISRIWNRFLETESAGRRPGQGRRWATTPNEDRYLVLTAWRHRNINTTLLQQHLRSATGTTVSTQTVRNRLHGVGLYARRPLSHFSVHPDNRRIFIWRDRGSRNNPAFVHESARFGGGGVLVYAAISIDGRTDFYIIRDGPLTAHRYRDEILIPIVVPYIAAIGDDFILMDDNSRPHRANLVEDFLFEEGIVRMEWPAYSPDMNLIENVWDALGRGFAGHQPPPQTFQEMERAVLEEWDRIPQLVINSFIDSMPQRCSTLLAVRRNTTPY
ncbi:transposable element Tcb2 transposase [Trichonephila clavipes]|nr:transposable element Tcb2 transposase [Trichonephila clavipes]